MRNGRKTIIAVTLENQANKNAKEYSVVKEAKRKLSLLHLIAVFALNLLDVLLLGVIFPYLIWVWIYQNTHARIVLKAIAEVTLELIMWVIFAGVSILMTATFVVEDICKHRKNDADKSGHPLNAQNEIAFSDKESNSSVPKTQNRSMTPDD